MLLPETLRFPPSSVNKPTRSAPPNVADSTPNTSSAEMVVGARVPITGSTVSTSDPDKDSDRATLDAGRVTISSNTFRTPLELSWIRDLFWDPLFPAVGSAG